MHYFVLFYQLKLFNQFLKWAQVNKVCQKGLMALLAFITYNKMTYLTYNLISSDLTLMGIPLSHTMTPVLNSDTCWYNFNWESLLTISYQCNKKKMFYAISNCEFHQKFWSESKVPCQKEIVVVKRMVSYCFGFW